MAPRLTSVGCRVAMPAARRAAAVTGLSLAPHAPSQQLPSGSAKYASRPSKNSTSIGSFVTVPPASRARRTRALTSSGRSTVMMTELRMPPCPCSGVARASAPSWSMPNSASRAPRSSKTVKLSLDVAERPLS